MNKKDILAILTLSVLVIFFFADVLFTDSTFVFRDFSRYFYPLYQYGVSSLNDGIIPFWNPYNYSGMPFLALIQLAIFYPLSIILYLFPFIFSIKLFIVTHYLLAGVFTYLLMRHWNLDTYSALISSITYTFSGYLLSCVDLTNTLISATWIPAIFFLYSKALKSGFGVRGSWFGFTVWTGVALGIQLLGGDPVVFYITLIVLFLFTCLHFSLNSFFKYILAVTVSLGLTLFQTVPFWELTSLSVRAKGVGLWEASTWSLSKYEVLNLICPFFTNANHLGQQQFFESLYPGILPLFLALIAITTSVFLKNYRKIVIFWGVIFISFIILSLGKDLVVYKFLYTHLPLFNMIRYPIKSFCIVNLSISILAGFGFKFLLDNLRQKSRFIFLFPSFILIGICIFCWLFTWIGDKAFFLFKIVDKPLYNYFYCPLTGVFLLFLISFLICVGRKIKLWTFSFAAIMLVIFDLIIFSGEINQVIDQNRYVCIPETAKFIKKCGGISRFILEPTTEERYRQIKTTFIVEKVFKNMQSVLAPNTGLYYFLFDAYGYEAIPIKDYDRFIYYVRSENLSKTLKLISMINVKHIISEEPILEKGIKLTCLIEDNHRIIRIYENQDVLPRAYLVPDAMVVKSRKEAFKALTSSSFDPRKKVILEEKSEIRNPQSPISNSQFTIHNSQFTIIKYQPNKVIITASSPIDCLLFLSDTYYPGWKAYIDGQETKIYRANYIFRAIKFPAGSHQVEFVYSPMSFKVGLLGSLLTLIILVIVMRGRLGNRSVTGEKIGQP
ncbi:MAG: YfhO family protein [Nitrospirota bacterium]